MMDSAKLTDWAFATEPEVVEVIEAAAATISRDFAGTIEYDDAVQEASIIVATKGDQAREALAKGPGVLHRMLWQDLADLVKTEAGHRAGHTSYEVLVDAGRDAEG